MKNIFILTNQIAHENSIARMAVIRTVATGIVRARQEELVKWNFAQYISIFQSESDPYFSVSLEKYDSIQPVLPHPMRSHFQTVTSDGNTVTDVSNPVTETSFLGWKVSINGRETEPDIRFIVACVPAGYIDLSKR